MVFNKKEYNKRYQQEHKEELKIYHRCYGRTYYQTNKERLAEKRRRRKEGRYKVDLRERQRIKLEVLGYYSNGTPKCAHCETTELVVLCLDHINGGGGKERRESKVGGGVNFLRWLKIHSYPLGYQVLCFNCNARKHLSQLPAFQP